MGSKAKKISTFAVQRGILPYTLFGMLPNVLRLCTKDEMRGAKDEAEGSVLTYVTEAEFRKQRRRSPSCNSLSNRVP